MRVLVLLVLLFSFSDVYGSLKKRLELQDGRYFNIVFCYSQQETATMYAKNSVVRFSDKDMKRLNGFTIENKGFPREYLGDIVVNYEYIPLDRLIIHELVHLAYQSITIDTQMRPWGLKEKEDQADLVGEMYILCKKEVELIKILRLSHDN